MKEMDEVAIRRLILGALVHVFEDAESIEDARHNLEEMILHEAAKHPFPLPPDFT